jgi:hypothetical protein
VSRMMKSNGWRGLLRPVGPLTAILAAITLGLVLHHSALTATNTWSSTGNMVSARERHTATLLPDGKVLVAGGAVLSTNMASTELYDPAKGTWVATGSMAYPRIGTAPLLPNGKVLLTGGAVNKSHVTSAELYDPSTGAWSTTGDLIAARRFHTATLLTNGHVLVAGGGWGDDSASAELYDPATGKWSTTGAMTTGRPSGSFLPG